MKYCKKCVMPDTRPGIKFNEEGVCYPCLNWERRKTIDWNARWRELEELADKYRNSNGDYYDCLITVSGGKDSYYQTIIFSEKLNMNPLLFNVDNFSWTKTGRQNLQNLNERFGCDILSISLNRRVSRLMAQKGFEKELIPNWYWDKAVYAFPLQVAIKLEIPLVVYGENIAFEYGGPGAKETPSALDQINNDVVKPRDWEYWLDDEIKLKDLNPAMYPTLGEIQRAKINPIYLSYFVPWDGYENYKLAEKYGFKTIHDEWTREGFMENYDQIDAIGYLVHPWFKFIKYGHFRVTDIASLWIRSGRMTREEAIELVNEEDYKLDRRALDDFLDFTGYSEQKFWEIVDRHANREILKKRDDIWRLKKPAE